MAGVEIGVLRVIRKLERLSETLECWNGYAPTEDELVQWIASVEAGLADAEQRLSRLKGRS